MCEESKNGCRDSGESHRRAVTQFFCCETDVLTYFSCSGEEKLGPAHALLPLETKLSLRENLRKRKEITIRLIVMWAGKLPHCRFACLTSSLAPCKRRSKKKRWQTFACRDHSRYRRIVVMPQMTPQSNSSQHHLILVNNYRYTEHRTILLSNGRKFFTNNFGPLYRLSEAMCHSASEFLPFRRLRSSS